MNIFVIGGAGLMGEFTVRDVAISSGVSEVTIADVNVAQVTWRWLR